MKTPSSNLQPDSDDEFITSLKRFFLRPPPPAWREEILAAAFRKTQTLAWHRSPWLRGMAAAWLISLGLWADTWRMAPQTSRSPSVQADSAGQFGQQDWQSLLASLEQSGPRHRP